MAIMRARVQPVELGSTLGSKIGSIGIRQSSILKKKYVNQWFICAAATLAPFWQTVVPKTVLTTKTLACHQTAAASFGAHKYSLL